MLATIPLQDQDYKQKYVDFFKLLFQTSYFFYFEVIIIESRRPDGQYINGDITFCCFLFLVLIKLFKMRIISVFLSKNTPNSLLF